MNIASISRDRPDAAVGGSLTRAHRARVTGRARLAAATLGIALFAGCGGSDDPGPATGNTGNDGAGGTTESPLATETKVAINAVRTSGRRCGQTDYPPTTALDWSAPLEQAALDQAIWLRDNNQFSHVGENGSDVGNRVTAAGYAWRTVAENIAGGQADVAAVVQAWVDSPEHCANLMTTAFRDIGLARVDGGSGNTYTSYWTLVLAAR
ncbi:MAG: CAP domain-containing protein [Burkholderiaceae bacterium]